MYSFLIRRAQILLVGGVILLFLFCTRAATAQTPWQRTSPRGAEDSTDRQQREQVQRQEPLIHGVVVGGGLAIYQGDFSRNPNHNIFKYLGTAKPTVQVGVDHRLGQFDQYGLGADLSFSHLSGATSGKIEFSNNMLSLDFYGDYELPYVKLGLFRVFAGGGPTLLINPAYHNFPDDADTSEKWRPDLGTRVVGAVKVGVTIYGSLKIGSRITSTDLLDGYLGFNRGGAADIVSFIKVTHRFNVK